MESDLPSTLDPATIYAITDSGETEIEKLIIRGMEFAGGVPDTGLPQVTKPYPNSVIDLGSPINGSASKVVKIKARNLTNNLTVEVGTGLAVTYGQTTGSSVTIPKADAILGADVTVAYTGTAELDDGAMTISHGNDMLASYTVTAVRVWEEIDLSAVPKVYGFPGGNGLFASNGQLQYSALVDASGCAQMLLTPSSNKAIYLLCKTAPPASPAPDSSYASYLCSGESGRRTNDPGNTYTIDLPDDCNYIVIGMKANAAADGEPYKPSLVKLK